MFTISEYVGVHWNSPDWNDERQSNAAFLIASCRDLYDIMTKDGVIFQINPKTNTIISGEVYGGFRPHECPIGAFDSSHKSAQAVDFFDPSGMIDEYLFSRQEKLIECGLYIEHPSSTPGWSHCTTRPPKSGHRVFFP